MMPRLSFTFNFKPIKIVVTSLAAFICCTYAVFSALNYVYWQPEEFSRKTWHSFYAQDKIDNLFLGSSHVYCGVNPAIMDNMINKENFNLSSSEQRIQESYFNLLEADRLYDIENVFLEVYYLLSTGTHGNYSDSSSMEVSWRNTDFMSPLSPVRYNALMNMNDTHHYIQALFPFTRFRKYLFNQYFISDNFRRKASADYKAYEFNEYHEDENYSVSYHEKGYFETDRLYNPETVYLSNRIPDEMTISDDALYYVNKIIQYCKSHDIQLTFFVAPLWPVELISTGSYDVFLESVKNIALTNQIAFYDFNLIRDDYLDLGDPALFFDRAHLNTTGAAAFSTLFAKIINGEYPLVDDLFYDSFEERMADSSPALFGAYICYPYRDLAKQNQLEVDSKNSFLDSIEKGFLEDRKSTDYLDVMNTRQLCLATNTDSSVEFRITISEYADTDAAADGKTPTIECEWLYQDYSVNSIVDLPESGSGICHVEWRSVDDKNNIHTMEFTY